MTKTALVLLIFIVTSITFAQSNGPEGDSLLIMRGMTNHYARHHDSVVAERQARLAIWRQKPYHIYIGADLMVSYNFQHSHLINSPSNAYPTPGNLSFLTYRFYVGLMIHRLNLVEIGVENVAHLMRFYALIPITSQLASQAYYPMGTWNTGWMVSVAYKRDIFPKSHKWKLYPGAFAGLDILQNPGFAYSSTSTFDHDTIVGHWQGYAKTSVVPIFGPTVDADVNFGHFTFGVKFRLYYSPVTVRGASVQIQHNSDSPLNFKIESPLLNFNWGIGLRYTF
jgi:hypothetical protein